MGTSVSPCRQGANAVRTYLLGLLNHTDGLHSVLKFGGGYTPAHSDNDTEGVGVDGAMNKGDATDTPCEKCEEHQRAERSASGKVARAENEAARSKSMLVKKDSQLMAVEKELQALRSASSATEVKLHHRSSKAAMSAEAGPARKCSNCPSSLSHHDFSCIRHPVML